MNNCGVRLVLCSLKFCNLVVNIFTTDCCRLDIIRDKKGEIFERLRLYSASSDAE